jgi:hypothetical protein
MARRFVEALNSFDGDAVGGLLTDDFEFSIGPHTSDRDDFLASLAKGPESDPAFSFVIESIDGTDVYGHQEYRWRETGELASTAKQVLRLELDGERVRRAAVEHAP